MKRKIIEIPLQLVSIEDNGFHLMVKAKIGTKKIRLLVDTGASKSVFDRDRLTNIIENAQFETSEHLSTGLGTNNMESHILMINNFKIGDIKIPEMQTVALDLSHVNESYKMIGDPGIDGVLGSDILNTYKAVIYYKAKKLKLYS